MTLKHLLEASVGKYADREALGFVGGDPITYARFLEMVRDMATLMAGRGAWSRATRWPSLARTCPTGA